MTIYIKPKVSLVVIHWNQERLTTETIHSLKQIRYPAYEILLVDNGSDDGSGNVIGQRFPDIRMVRSDVNLGYTGGANLGMVDALSHGADYVFVLNNDIEVEPDILNELIAAMASSSFPRAGMAAPTIYFHDTSHVIWYGGGECDPATGIARHTDFGKTDNLSAKSPTPCTFINGCAMFIPREVIDTVGLLDTSYFHTGEDVDYSIRVKRAGYTLLMVPNARLWHKVRSSMGGNVPSNPRYNYYEFRNRLLIYKKYFFKERVGVKPVFRLVDFYLRHIYYQLRQGSLRDAVAIVHGACHGIMGRRGKVL